MAYPVAKIPVGVADGGAAAGSDYGEWTGHRIPDDRGGWHPLNRQFYDYWLSIAPAGALPGRQHIQPEQMAPWLSRLWLLDVHRAPLRFRCRLVGSDMVRTIGREITGEWLHDVHPRSATDPRSRERFRFVVEQALPTWRRGAPRWVRQPDFTVVESLLLPLAADGCSVDKIIAVSIAFDPKGRLN